VKELFREAIGVHTCDRRSSKTYIHENYPTYTFEQGFVEEDPLWNPVTRETDSAEDKRLRTVLDDVFSHDDSTFISVTSHSGAISSMLRGEFLPFIFPIEARLRGRGRLIRIVLGHRVFSLNTGAVIPVLVKAEMVEGPAPTMTVQPYTTVSTCATPPPKPTS
jgi:hypothetical protein